MMGCSSKLIAKGALVWAPHFYGSKALRKPATFRTLCRAYTNPINDPTQTERARKSQWVGESQFFLDLSCFQKSTLSEREGLREERNVIFWNFNSSFGPV